VVAVADTGEAEAVEVQGVLSGASKKIAELGTAEALEPSPDGSFVALSTAKNELWLVNMGDGSAKLLDSSKYGPITEVAWHEGSEWIAYSFPEGPFTQSLKLANAKNGKVYPLTSPTAYDFSPSFDPEGNFLYYLSARSLNASLDRAIFEMGFPRPVKPYLVSLSPRPSPFVKSTDLEKPPEKAGEKSPEEQKGISAVQIEGIQDRIEPFPIEEGNYAKVAGLRKSKVSLLSFSAEAQPGKPSGAIDVFDVKTGSKERLISNVSGFSTNGSLLLVRAGEQLRVVDPERKPDLSVQEPGEKSGIIDASRIKVYVEPQDEWRQMLKETWRLMRDNYWKEDLMGKNWEQVLNKYERLLPRIGTRFELSDLIREMQGEMGTSHSYEIGGEYDLDRPYTVGGLGAEFEATESGYRITRLFEGDRSTEGEKSPLKSAGLTVGDLIVEIDGAPLDGQTHPSKALLNRGGDVISLKVIHNGKEQRVSVRVLKDERTLVYRDWVERNRGYVHEKSGEKLGYVHIPDMGGRGFSEFYRLYKAEAYRDGLIIDLRYNSGGFISSLLLEKLSRKRLGEERPRVGKPTPYPVDAPPAVMVALANEATGSDGDIFSHAFKMLKLGTLIGVRTWGGVIGINPRRRLVDGTVVTQPQFAFFFNDIGLGLENKGEEPDIAVDITPSDYASGRDVQLDKAIEEALRRLSAA
ncbi:MAG TPA: PDZ domain-containing protein, partial [Thermoprotei archaeon]|nr:PDZ domain-containing protein [Thermoprotei archaeon]